MASTLEFSLPSDVRFQAAMRLRFDWRENLCFPATEPAPRRAEGVTQGAGPTTRGIRLTIPMLWGSTCRRTIQATWRKRADNRHRNALQETKQVPDRHP